MSTKTYVVDSTDTTRYVKKIFVVDSGSVARKIKRIWMIDSGSVARLVFTGADYLSMVAGTTAGSSGYLGGVFGTLTPHVLGDGATVEELTAANAFAHNSIFEITGYPGSITSSYLLSLTVGATTLLATAATFAGGGSGGAASWTWSTGFAINSGSTYAVVVQRT
jgi:hypothetical protein